MPSYDYRCNACGHAQTLFYKTYHDYDQAVKRCEVCDSADLTRLISRVTISKPGRDYRRLSSGEMLSVLEGGDSREVGQMMRQMGQDEASLGDTYHQVADRLSKGEAPASIEADLGDS